MKKAIIIFGILASVAVSSFVAYQYWSSSKLSSVLLQTEDTQQVQQGIVAASISGKSVLEEKAKRRPLAIVIDNSPEAHPQFGIAVSEIVYETLAEGGTTRLLALFQSADTKVGPIRSARDYFATIAGDWQALFAHVGGSPATLQDIAKGAYPGLIDLNQFYKGSYFERSPDFSAPHNVFTDTVRLYDFLGGQAMASSQRRTLFNFKNDEPVVRGVVKNVVVVPVFSVSINFSFSQFKAEFIYNPQTNRYSRNIGGKPDIDAATKKQVEAKTIIVQYAGIVPVPKDKEGRLSVNLVSQGRAQIFMDGQMHEVMWKKTQHGRTIFVDSEGKEMNVNKGLIWVAIVPNNKPNVVTYDGAVVNPDGSVEVNAF